MTTQQDTANIISNVSQSGQIIDTLSVHVQAIDMFFLYCIKNKF